MKKIPCIIGYDSVWEYVYPYLREWGYEILKPVTFDTYKLLVINYAGILGTIGTESLNYNKHDYNREFVDCVEEFLERAAELMGYTYNRKDVMPKDFDITKLEVGMIVEHKNGHRSIVLSTEDNDIFLSELGTYRSCLDKDLNKSDIYKVYKIAGKFSLIDLVTTPDYLTLVWERPKVISLSMKDIAEKFGISLEQLNIAK